MTSTTAGPGTALPVSVSVTGPGAPLPPQPVRLTGPLRDRVRVAVAASGVCHADLSTAGAPPASRDRRDPRARGRRHRRRARGAQHVVSTAAPAHVALAGLGGKAPASIRPGEPRFRTVLDPVGEQ